MTKKTYRTWLTGELVTATMFNEQIRDNGNELWKGTTKGDIDYYDSATEKVRLPIGDETHVLTVKSGVPSWETIGKVVAREGGDSTNWATSGSSHYMALDDAKIQAGSTSIVITSSNSGSAVIDYPQAFTGTPIITFSKDKITPTIQDIGLLNITNTDFAIEVKLGATTTVTFNVYWVAMGI